jgi:D-glycero-D-manno-heptose 1,7-bisphosphate phosphatase
MDRAEPAHAPLETVAEGCYRRLNPTCAALPPGRPAVFLDRDGVLLRMVDYLWRPSDAQFLAGAVDALRRLNAAGLPVVLVTNQAGIGRGYFDWPAFQKLHVALEAQMAADHAHLDAVYACAHHHDARPPFDHPEHPWRKPKPGMIQQAAADLGIDLAASWLIGDHLTDIQAGLAAGLDGVVHVRSGLGNNHRADIEALVPEFDTEILTADDLSEAAGLILARVCPVNK